MIKKIAILLIVSYIFCILTCDTVFGGTSEEDAEKKAEEIHGHASSDVIFIDNELKALYYQNVQIISILKEIRELLREKLQKKEE